MQHLLIDFFNVYLPFLFVWLVSSYADCFLESGIYLHSYGCGWRPCGYADYRCAFAHLPVARPCICLLRVRAFVCCASVHLSVARPCICLLRVRAFVRCASAHLSIARSRNRHQYSATAVSILLGTYMPFPAAVCAALGWEGAFGSLAINKSAFSLFSNRKTLLLCADVRQS